MVWYSNVLKIFPQFVVIYTLIQISCCAPGFPAPEDLAKFLDNFDLRSIWSIQDGLNKIPYDYTMDVSNRLKQLDLLDRVPKGIWTEAYNIVQEAVTKTIPKKKKCKKAEGLSEEALQIAEERREVKGKGERERYT